MEDVLGNMTNEQLEKILQVQKGSQGVIKPMISTGITADNLGPRRGSQTILTTGSPLSDAGDSFRRSTNTFLKECMNTLEENRRKTKDESIEKLEKRELEVKPSGKQQWWKKIRAAKEKMKQQVEPRKLRRFSPKPYRGRPTRSNLDNKANAFGMSLKGVSEDTFRQASDSFVQNCMNIIEESRGRTKEKSIKKLEKKELEVRQLKKDRLRDKLREAKEKMKQQVKPSWIQKAKEKMKREKESPTPWQNLPTKRKFGGWRPGRSTRGISSDPLRFLQSLPAANWEKVYGGRPTTPDYPYIPIVCPQSIFTNLKRIFFSGVNVLAGLDQLIAQGQSQQAKEALNQLGTEWNKWLEAVRSNHGTTSANNEVIDALKEVFDYVFKQTDIDEFKRLFNNLAFSATNPQRFFQLVNKHFEGIKGGYLGR